MPGLPQVAGWQPFVIGASWTGSEVITWVASQRPAAPDSRMADVICKRPLSGGALLPIRAATGTPGKLVKAGPEPRAVVITPNGDTAYVDDFSGPIIPVRTATNTPGKPIKTASGIVRLAVTPSGTAVYVSSWESGVVTVISTATDSVIKRIKVGHAFALAITP